MHPSQQCVEKSEISSITQGAAIRMEFFSNPIIAFLSFLTAILFTVVALAVPPGGGNLVAAIFTAGMGAMLGGEEKNDEYEKEIADEDI